MSKVEKAAADLQALMEKQEAILKDVQIGLSRRDMLERLKPLRGEVSRIINYLSSY